MVQNVQPEFGWCDTAGCVLLSRSLPVQNRACQTICRLLTDCLVSRLRLNRSIRRWCLFWNWRMAGSQLLPMALTRLSHRRMDFHCEYVGIDGLSPVRRQGLLLILV